jgi:antitoxin component of RelBE/YafQ-DinJ toxin-antitoxin module
MEILIKTDNSYFLEILNALLKQFKIKSEVISKEEKTPNRETIKAIEDSRNGKVIKTSGKADLFKKLKS